MRLNIPVEFSANYLILPLIILASLLYAHAKWTIIIASLFIIILAWSISRFKLQYYLLFAIAALLPFSFEYNVIGTINVNIPTEPLLVVAVFSVVFNILKQPRLLFELFNKESLWIIPLLLCYIMCAFTSTMTIVSIKFSIVNITYILVFFIWQKYLLRKKNNFFPKLITLYSLSIFAVIIYGLYKFSQYNWEPATIKGTFRPFYSDHTIFGASTAILATFWLLYSLNEKMKSLKIIYFIAGLFFAAAVIFSTSRAAILSLSFFVLVSIIIFLSIRLKYIIGVLIIGIIFSFIYRNELINKLYSNKYMSHDYRNNYLEQIESSGNISSDVSNIERLNRWVSGIKMFVERPIFGFGPGTYQFKYIPFQKKEFMNRLTVMDPWHVPANSGGTAHSEYILLISEMGILGLISFLLIICRLTWIAFQRSNNLIYRKFIVLAFAVLSTYLFHACFNNFLNTDKFAFLFWGFAAWIVALYESKNNNENLKNIV
jgi:O-antigen ligase